MNHQLILKKLALSALLVSAVAAPTATNAASGGETKASSQIITAPTANGLTKITSTTISRVNPLDLAKTYAPNTLEDWEKTLEQYKKVIGDMNNVQMLVNMDKDGNKLDHAFEIKSDEVSGSIKVVPMSAAEINNVEFIIDMEKVNIEPDQDFEINMDDTEALEGTLSSLITTVDAVDSVQLVQLNTVDQAFFKAEEALSDAAKSKDAALIKEALADLLVQYKDKIKDLETAK